MGYLLATYPSKEEFLDIIKACNDTKLDIFEIGVPSNNPYADGETIKRAHTVADKAIDEAYFRAIRNATDKPIWLMGYKEDLIDTQLYLKCAKEGVIDALVMPDISDELRAQLRVEMEAYQVDVLGFVNPQMSSEEMGECFKNHEIVYEQLFCGPTGTNNNTQDYKNMLSQSLEYPQLVKVAGFGISTKEQSKELIDSGFNGIVIGTEMIRKLNVSISSLTKYINEIGNAI